MGSPLQVLGARIRDLRKARGWSQERFADICGVHRTYMGHLERGEKNVSFNTLSRLADSLGITIAELVSEDAKTFKNLRTGRRKSEAAKRTDLDRTIRILKERTANLEETAKVLRQVLNLLQNNVST